MVTKFPVTIGKGNSKLLERGVRNAWLFLETVRETHGVMYAGFRS